MATKFKHQKKIQYIHKPVRLNQGYILESTGAFKIKKYIPKPHPQKVFIYLICGGTWATILFKSFPGDSNVQSGLETYLNFFLI